MKIIVLEVEYRCGWAKALKPLALIKTGTTIDQIRREHGDFEDWFAAGLGINRLARVDVYLDQPLPDINGFSGVLITGSPSMVSAREVWSETTASWLKNFLKQQSEFNDYDFDGSGLNVLLDVLAYNTHYNALNAHYSLNESFLDSAQIRGNVVTRAKLLGYTPRSVLSPRAKVDLVVNVAAEVGTKPTILELTRGTKLNTVVSGEEFQYVVLETQQATLSAVTANTYQFNDVSISEGSIRELKYRVDNDKSNSNYYKALEMAKATGSSPFPIIINIH